MKPERLGRQTIYESDWVDLHVDRVRMPAGRIVEKYHVLDFPFEAVTALVENGRGELLLIRSYRYVVDMVAWEIPAGRIGDGEALEEAARREVMEETGCATAEYERAYSYFPMYGMANQVFHIVRCRATSDTGEFDRNEVAEVRWFSREEVGKMVATGEIRDGFSLTGMLLWLLG